ncbi:ufm1-specific protease 2-like [Cotesia glomerata]|uniref:ufm1-specific protease 2-like n=1 Tax=Cotesia glomerata TaxID=32391 RepID=UPI001D02B715|nr:ufm1-specific protease 2-like [Cotesia glomerata]
MTPKVRISSKVVAKLECLGSASTGRLFGVMCDNYLTVLSFVLNPKLEQINDDDDQESQHQNSAHQKSEKKKTKKNELLKPIDLQLNMPVEIDLCGVLFVDNHEENIPEAFKDIDITDNPLLIKYSRASGISAYYYVHEQLKSAGKLEFIDEKLLLDKFSYVRLRTSVPMITDKNDFSELFQCTRKNIASGTVGFYFPSTKLFLTNNDTEDREVSVKLLSSTNASFPTGYTNAIEVEMFMCITKDKTDDTKKNYAPVLQHVKQPFVNYEFNLKIDSLALIGHNQTAPQIYSILVESVCRSLRLIERSIILSSNNTVKIPEMMHFKLPHCDHLVSIAYADTSAEKTQEYRKKLHEAFACDLTRPYFRPGNAVKFLSDYKPDQPLLEPHTAIKTSKDNSSFVSGMYAYYHYGQDNFHDSGWGCAYRSLQTIFSWFRFQGYTEQKVPTHRAIQKSLVDIGDKPSSFIGTNQWIGSTEVGFVLETLLNVNSKFLIAASGKDMPDLLEDLRQHFQTQGTPVMIGGGVLAHTILGVIYDESKQLPYWLILDPHYEGKENLSTVLEKGYCGWKGKEFWRKDAFYNMCLPQRPIYY